MGSRVLVDWIHPSVRDTVIEYLMEHDAERAKFLRTARASGVLTGLGSAGGSNGTRVRPLVINSSDWDALRDTVCRIAGEADFVQHDALIQALREALRASETEHQVVSRLKDVAKSFLSTLTETWSSRVEGIPVRSLERFYALSIVVDELIASPNLSDTWSQSVADVETATSGEMSADGLQAIKNWIDLIRVIRRNEPRFLAIGSREQIIDHWLQAIVSWVNDWAQDLRGLDEYETEWLAAEEGDWEKDAEVPVQPDGEEVEERFLVEEITSLIRSVPDEAAGVLEVDQELLSRLRVHESVRVLRQDRYDEWDASMRGYAQEWRYEGSGRSGELDVEEMFTDL